MKQMDEPLSDSRLHLPNVTLCAVTSVNLKATLGAIHACTRQIRFGRCILLTDIAVETDHEEIEIIRIDRLTSSREYSRFMLHGVANYIDTSHLLVVQWDGHVLDAGCWQPEFLEFDYIGATWPQFDDAYRVGNGGFSLRSRRIMQICQTLPFSPLDAEDIAICRVHRPALEAAGMRFAPSDLADRFAAERAGDVLETFGYHGAWNMPAAIGLESFWEMYLSLDARGTIWVDFWRIAWRVLRSKGGWGRVATMFSHRFFRTRSKRPSISDAR